jgi:hypothetical protein
LVVPAGQTLASGSAPHSLASHWRKDTVPPGSDHPHTPAFGAHAGFADVDELGTSPHVAVAQGATNSSASRVVPVLVPSAGGAFGVELDVDVPEHAKSVRVAKRTCGRNGEWT